MDIYHSRITLDDLNDLIIRYKIPHDLHPRLPSEDFVMSELPDDAIGHLGLNKVITFEVLCRSLEIASTAIPDAMVWRHSDAAIDDPRPDVGSFNMVDVRRLNAHVIKLRDMPKGVLVLFGLSCVWKSRVCDSLLQGANGNVMGIHDFLCLPEWTGVEVQEEPHLDDLAIGTPSFKIVAKAEAYQKQKGSTSGATLSHVAKRTRSALAQSSGSTTRPNLFVGDNDESDDDDDACVKILLVTPLRSAAMIPPRETKMGAPDVFNDVIHKDIFLFFVGPYYATYPKDGVSGNYEFTQEEWDASYRPTFGVLTKEVFKDPVICKTSIDQFPTPGEMLLDHYRRLNQSYHEYVLSTDSMLKGYEEKVANIAGLELQVSALKKQVFRLNDKLSSSDASFAKSKAKGKGKGRKKRSSLLLRGELLSLAASAGFERGLSLHQTKDEFDVIYEHAVEPLSVILQLEPKKLVRPANVPTPRDARVSPLGAKESTVTSAFKSLELSTYVDLIASVVAFEHNEEMVSAEVDGSDPKMTNDTITTKSEHAFVQGMSVVLDDAIGDGLTPSFVAGEEVVVNPSGV
uniref:Transposase (Putative), gypsy type n=1 Tax=Tanacetum cinerariifolium TaxID=118510 RepID=A0A699IT33_TANCI|nr:hypothetical protein [Tanacetum cinerariifolium]GEZ73769.1 hypothetical protein [Tanacetum cinerariifolium]